MDHDQLLMRSVTSRYGCRHSRPRAPRCCRPPRDADGRRPAPVREPAAAEPAPDPTRGTPGDAAVRSPRSPPRRQPPPDAGCCGRADRLGELRAAQGDVARSSTAVVNQCGWRRSATTYQWLPEVLRELRERQPGAEVRIETVPDDETIAVLLDAQIDVALINKLHGQADACACNTSSTTSSAVVASATSGPAGPMSPRPTSSTSTWCCARATTRAVCRPCRSLPIGAQPQRLTTLPLTDLLIEMVASGGDVVTILPSWVVAPYLRTHDLASVQVGAAPQAHLVLRNPSRSTAGERRRLRRGPDRATRHAASARLSDPSADVGRRGCRDRLLHEHLAAATTAPPESPAPLRVGRPQSLMSTARIERGCHDPGRRGVSGRRRSTRRTSVSRTTG